MTPPADTLGDDQALFLPDGGRVMPTARARGPWSGSALHGGPVAALVVGSVEDQSPDDGLQLARVTLELIRPVPVAPLTVSSSLVRPGRKVQLVDTVVEADGVEVAWSRALRIRRATGEPQLQATVPEDQAPPPPEDGTPNASASEYQAFHNDGAEMRYVDGAFDRPGPATVWIRLRCPVVAGTETSAWQRVVAAADFGNGVSAELEFGPNRFINPDLTVYVHRPPVGEWICLDARTRFGAPGIGATESALWDRQSRIGRSVQSLVVETSR